MARRISEAVRSSILAALKDGQTKYGIARDLGVSHGTVRKIAREAGLTILPPGPELEKASEVHILEGRRRRAALSRQLLDRAEKQLAKLSEPAIVYAFNAKEDHWSEHVLDEPDFKGQQNIAITLGILIDKSLQLERYDEEGVGAAKAAIISLVDGLKADAEQAS